MGESRSKGNTHEERRAHALDTRLEDAEVVVMLSRKDGKLTMSMIARDDPPDAQSSAVKFAAFLSANFTQLAGEAMALSNAHQASEEGETDAPQQGVHLIDSDTAKGTILGADGRVINSERLAGEGAIKVVPR